MAVTFETILRANGNNTGIEVPVGVLAELGAGQRPRVKVTVGTYSFSTTIGAMGGRAMIAFSKAHREASGLVGGDAITVTLEVDEAPAQVVVPAALAEALADRGRTEAFDRLAPSRRKEHARQVNEAKTDETRSRRIAKILESLGD